jgi:hypothetical protein
MHAQPLVDESEQSQERSILRSQARWRAKPPNQASHTSRRINLYTVRETPRDSFIICRLLRLHLASKTLIASSRSALHSTIPLVDAWRRVVECRACKPNDIGLVL